MIVIMAIIVFVILLIFLLPVFGLWVRKYLSWVKGNFDDVPHGEIKFITDKNEIDPKPPKKKVKK